MALPTSYQWTPANNGTKFPSEHASHVAILDRAEQAQRQREHDVLVWGLCIAVVCFLAVICGMIRFRRIVAAKEAERLSCPGKRDNDPKMLPDLSGTYEAQRS